MNDLTSRLPLQTDCINASDHEAGVLSFNPNSEDYVIVTAHFMATVVVLAPTMETHTNLLTPRAQDWRLVSRSV